MVSVNGRFRRGSGRGGWRVVALSLLALCAICFISVGVVRFYPYETAYPRFPRVTHTRSGAPGDPINLIVVGARRDISSAFQRAGWLTPDPITPQTSAHIAAASLAHQSYPTAPVSDLYVFGRPQDLAFEKPTNDVQYRDHIRLWQTDQSLDGAPIWVAQASYDAGIELGSTNGFPTHHIAPAIDRERETVGASLQKTGAVTQSAVVMYAPPIFYARNGGGDFYESDGAALVINLTPGYLSVPPQPWVIGGLRASMFLIYDAVVSAGAPLVIIVTLVAVLVLAFAIYRGATRTRNTA